MSLLASCIRKRKLFKSRKDSNGTYTNISIH
jgi:hypothetical protein